MDVEKPSSSPSKWRKIINNLRENKNFQEFCCLAVFVGSIGIIVLVIILTAKASSADDQLNFEVKNISFTSFNIRSSKINFHSGVQFSIRNPLKSNIFYSNFASSLSYKDEIIAQNVTSPFIQPKKSQMQVNATFVAKDVSFSDKRFMDFLLVDTDFGEVTFKITIYVETDRSDGLVDLVCKDLNVVFWYDGEVGKLSGGPNQCDGRKMLLWNPRFVKEIGA